MIGRQQSRTGLGAASLRGQPVTGRGWPRQTGWKPVLLFILLLSGCKEEAAHRKAAANEPVYSKQYRQASATVIVSLSETNIPSSGKIRLMVDVHAPTDAEVAIPEIGALVDPFLVADGYAEPVQFLPNGKHLHRRVWMLVPGLPGKAVFQPLEIQVGTETIKTQPVAVGVTSLLPEGIETYQIKDIAKPVELLPEEKKRQQLKYILLGFSVAVALSAWLVSVVRRPKKIEVLSPPEAALRALGALPDDAMARIDGTRRILLEYLEDQFQVQTAGKTTGEIIRNIPKYPLLGRRITLVDSLTTNDLVRFSNRIPEGYVDDFVGYVRGFVEETSEALCD